MSPVSRILVPVDFAAPSTAALEYAKRLAESLGATIDLLHVVPNPYVTEPVETVNLYRRVGPQFLDSVVEDVGAKLEGVVPPAERERLGVRSVVKVGDPRVEISEYATAEGIDLIVMATHGRTGVAHLFLGSVAERVVRTAPCPVLTLRDGTDERTEASPKG